MPGPLCQADFVLAVDAVAVRTRGRQVKQTDVLAQPADDNDAQIEHWQEKRSRRIGTIDGQPHLHLQTQRADRLHEPSQQFHAELMFGAKFPGVMFFRQFGHVDLADVQHRAQRHRDHTPQRMRRQPGQGDPVVSVEPLAVGRSGSRIVMDAGTFHVPSIT